MRQKIFFIVLTISAVFIMIGCASKRPRALQPKTDPAIEQLNKAASSIQADLKLLSKIKQAGYEKVELYKTPKDGPLTKKITLKWAGPVHDILEIIALSIDYEYKLRGQRPESPVLVNVDEIRVSAFKILEDLGWKIGKHQLSVDAGKEMIQLTYFEPSFPDGLNAKLQSGE